MIILNSDALSQIYKKKLIWTFFFTNARNVRMIAKTSVFFIKKEKKKHFRCRGIPVQGILDNFDVPSAKIIMKVKKPTCHGL